MELDTKESAMDSRTVVLTGVTRGFGRETVELLIRERPQDHYVVLARRDGERLAAELVAATGASGVTGVDCDLASLAEIRRAATEILRELDTGQLPPLGGYLGNAGLTVTTTDLRTTDGYEMTFGVNVLSHYLLVRELLPRFTGPGWIVLTSSDCHFGQFRYTLGATPPPRWETPERLATPRPGGAREAGRAYATSKLGVIHLTHALARRLPDGVGVHSYNPALVAGTDFFRHAPGPVRGVLNGFFQLQRVLGRGMTPQQAGARLAETILAGPTAQTGSYLDRGRAVPSSPESYDEAREEELWREAALLVDADRRAGQADILVE
ncbi:SDR family NAD(P)-dependent oxidoreductase [Streptomyces sp. NPDC047024]|uniref:SDR family NAD(P)-dependent oxidoreductase n=1 Tax=Streptomyces sp. NPDC047024 TaxID=3155476 RepID=UPI0033E2A803